MAINLVKFSKKSDDLVVFLLLSEVVEMVQGAYDVVKASVEAVEWEAALLAELGNHGADLQLKKLAELNQINQMLTLCRWMYETLGKR